jgi:hypothetical protein
MQEGMTDDEPIVPPLIAFRETVEAYQRVLGAFRILSSQADANPQDIQRVEENVGLAFLLMLGSAQGLTGAPERTAPRITQAGFRVRDAWEASVDSPENAGLAAAYEAAQRELREAADPAVP